MNEQALKLVDQLHPHWKAYPYQQAWAADSSAHKLGIKARQIGITTTEAIKRFVECLGWKESEKRPDPPVIVFCSPSMRQSTRLMTYVQRTRSAFEKLYKTDVKFRKEREDWLCFDNRAEIWSLPNNPRTIEGIDASDGVIDEFGNFAGTEDQEVYESLMGSLGAKGGGLTIFGKPRGRRGMFWRFADPYGEFFSEFSVHRFPYTVRAECDPRYAETVEKQRSLLTSSGFAENYLCEFIDEGIIMFPYDLIDRQTDEVPQWRLKGPFNTANPLYMGIDFGRMRDKTAIILVEHGEPKSRVRMIETSTEQYDKQLARISKLIDYFKPVKVLVDETGLGRPLLDQLEAQFASRVEGVIFSNPVKEKMLLITRNLLQDGSLLIPPNAELKDQLHGIEKETTDLGNVRYTGKRTETEWHDDMAWALFLACFQLGEGHWEMTMIGPTEKKKASEGEQWAYDVTEDWESR